MNWQPPVTVDSYDGKHRQPSLALDRTDTPYISFCVDNTSAPLLKPQGFIDIISIAFLQGSRWRNKILDGRVVDYVDPPWPPNFNYPSLAIDRDGQAHVSYVRAQIDSPKSTELVYATFSIEELQTPIGPPDPHRKPWDSPWCDLTSVADNKPTCCALTLDQSGTPYILWRTENGALFCAHKSSGAWTTSTVLGPTNLDAGKIDIALDTSDAIRVSYFNKNDGSVGYASSTDQGSSWISEIVSSTSVGQQGTSIACRDGVPSIAYGGYPPCAAIMCATREVSPWGGLQCVECAYGAYPSLAVSAGQSLCVTYTISGIGLKYAYQEGARWVIDLIDADAYLWSSLAISSSNLPHVAYMNAGDVNTKYTHAVP